MFHPNTPPNINGVLYSQLMRPHREKGSRYCTHSRRMRCWQSNRQKRVQIMSKLYLINFLLSRIFFWIELFFLMFDLSTLFVALGYSLILR